MSRETLLQEVQHLLNLVGATDIQIVGPRQRAAAMARRARRSLWRATRVAVAAAVRSVRRLLTGVPLEERLAWRVLGVHAAEGPPAPPRRRPPPAWTPSAPRPTPTPARAKRRKRRPQRGDSAWAWAVVYAGIGLAP